MFTYAAKLIEVIDGDTVDLLIDLGFGVHARERCRLYGIDAPEMPTEAGKAAKAYLESLLGAATGELSDFIKCFPGQCPIFISTIKAKKAPKEKADKYGRYLAILYYTNGDMEAEAYETKIAFRPTSLNWRMVAGGHAKERYW